MRSIFNYNDYERERFVAEVAQELPPGVRVLDAGAGPCRYKHLFSHCEYKSQDFAQYPGDDHSYGALDYVGDITEIAAPDGSFDCILCTEVFEHIPRPDLAVREFARLLRPGGLLFITAPLGSGIHMPPYFYYGGFSPYWYEHFLPAAGISVESILPNGGFFKLYGQESRRFLTLLTPARPLGRALFFPVKFLFALWFRILLPAVCHYLDRFDKKNEFTAGYFVRGRKFGPTGVP